MSYILDALKKAEAERNQGAIPNVHASPAFAAPLGDKPPAWRKPLLWTSAAALVVAGGLAFYKPWQSADSVAQDGPPAVRTAQTPATIAAGSPVAGSSPAGSPAAGLSPAGSPAAGSPAAGSPAAPVSESPGAAPDTPVAMMPAPPSAPPKEAAVTASPKTKPAADTPAKQTPQEAAKPAAPPVQEAKAVKEQKPAANREAADEPRIVTLRELPQDIQSQIPPLTVNGYIYADKPADRTVLINQRLLREGEQVAPDLRLEKLMPSGMVLNFRGHRYRTSY
jgi:general secretion pathway protein B